MLISQMNFSEGTLNQICLCCSPLLPPPPWSLPSEAAPRNRSFPADRRHRVMHGLWLHLIYQKYTKSTTEAERRAGNGHLKSAEWAAFKYHLHNWLFASKWWIKPKYAHKPSEVGVGPLPAERAAQGSCLGRSTNEIEIAVCQFEAWSQWQDSGRENQIVLFGASRGNTIKYEPTRRNKLNLRGKQSPAENWELLNLNNGGSLTALFGFWSESSFFHVMISTVAGQIHQSLPLATVLCGYIGN